MLKLKGLGGDDHSGLIQFFEQLAETKTPKSS